MIEWRKRATRSSVFNILVPPERNPLLPHPRPPNYTAGVPPDADATSKLYFPSSNPSFRGNTPDRARTDPSSRTGQNENLWRTSCRARPFRCDARSRQAVPNRVLCREPELEHQSTSSPRFGVTPGDLGCRGAKAHPFPAQFNFTHSLK